MLEYLLLPLSLIILLAILAFPLIVIYLFIRLTEEAFEKVGFGHWHAAFMVFGSVLGSMIDIPLHSGTITSYPPVLLNLINEFSIPVQTTFHPIVLSVNLGGCLIPMAISIDLIVRGRAKLYKALIGILFVAVITYKMATPVANEGIMLPVYVPPAIAAFTGIVLAKGYNRAPALAYICGSMGTLLGADILNLLTPGVLPALAPPSVHSKALPLSIGGAGVFDGIFLTGVLSVLLASIIVCLFNRSKCSVK